MILTDERKKAEKSALRKRMLARRAALPSEMRTGADQKIFERLTALPEYLSAKTIFAYISVADEPDTSRIIAESFAHGKTVCAPRCAAFGVMDAYAIDSPKDLIPGKYDIPEPAPHCRLIPPESVDLIITPCVCCDRQGYRLGYGGGFYDRWLDARRASAAVLCFEEMLVDEVPREPHDERADILVTDRILHFFTRA